mgnify:CR=1 FL=1
MALRREKKRIGDMLINENVITQEQLEQALKKSKETHKKIGETLVELGFTNELPERLIGDKAYDSDALDARLE